MSCDRPLRWWRAWGPQRGPSGSLVVVVDAFRASTTISVLISKGAEVLPVVSIEEARVAEADFRIGERGSVKVAGFDFGNSPMEVQAATITPGSTVALSTTNGTRIVEAAAGAILHRLQTKGAKLDERARRAVALYLNRPQGVLRNNSAARRLKRVGYEADLDFCLAEDTLDVVP
ncbi:MAG TPA: 2-phosphosulfolactate phosphatase, partial [Rubrobacteraceae bacterium]|nr:2-phosphosulfolactate phosphatase [Rubrobacteraceae bacterium]